METYLPCFVHACPSKWSQWLSLAEFWYNTSQHSALGRSPFEVLYGHPPRHFGITAASHCSVPELSVWLEKRGVMQDFVGQRLLHAQQRMKRQANKGRSERSFQVGEWVFLKLQPCVVRFILGTYTFCSICVPVIIIAITTFCPRFVTINLVPLHNPTLWY